MTDNDKELLRSYAFKLCVISDMAGVTYDLALNEQDKWDNSELGKNVIEMIAEIQSQTFETCDRLLCIS